jgi:hypothetical protein
LATEDQFERISQIEQKLNFLLAQASAQQCVLVRVGTSANCNMTKDRNRVDFTLLARTKSDKAFLYWVKESIIDLHPEEFT